MRAVKIDQCRLCIVLSAKVPTRDEPVLADKEVLLTALNIKALRCATLFSYRVGQVVVLPCTLVEFCPASF